MALHPSIEKELEELVNKLVSQLYDDIQQMISKLPNTAPPGLWQRIKRRVSHWWNAPPTRDYYKSMASEGRMSLESYQILTDDINSLIDECNYICNEYSIYQPPENEITPNNLVKSVNDLRSNISARLQQFKTDLFNGTHELLSRSIGPNSVIEDPFAATTTTTSTPVKRKRGRPPKAKPSTENISKDEDATKDIELPQPSEEKNKGVKASFNNWLESNKSLTNAFNNLSTIKKVWKIIKKKNLDENDFNREFYKVGRILNSNLYNNNEESFLHDYYILDGDVEEILKSKIDTSIREQAEQLFSNRLNEILNYILRNEDINQTENVLTNLIAISKQVGDDGNEILLDLLSGANHTISLEEIKKMLSESTKSSFTRFLESRFIG